MVLPRGRGTAPAVAGYLGCAGDATVFFVFVVDVFEIGPNGGLSERKMEGGPWNG